MCVSNKFNGQLPSSVSGQKALLVVVDSFVSMQVLLLLLLLLLYVCRLGLVRNFCAAGKLGETGHFVILV